MERLGEIVSFEDLSEQQNMISDTCGVLFRDNKPRCTFKPRLRFECDGRYAYACNIPRHQRIAQKVVCENETRCIVFKQKILYDYRGLETIEAIHVDVPGECSSNMVSLRLNQLQNAKTAMDESKTCYMQEFNKYIELKQMVRLQLLEVESSLQRAQRSKRCHDLQYDQLNKIVMSRENFCLQQTDKETVADTCNVCLDSVLAQSGCLPCKHVFHTECMRKWFTFGNMTCPTCRTSVTMQWVIDTSASNG
jgi:Zn finger protein HypA/HybF involved in hydrogenase expression